jgi:hypothetical protein
LVYHYVFKDDVQEVKEILNSYEYTDPIKPINTIVHVELLKSNEAIAIYETTDDDIVFGNALLKKTLFGWRVMLTVNMVNRNQFRLQTKKIIWEATPFRLFSPELLSSRNKNKSIVNGKILDPDIKEHELCTSW